MENKRKRPWEKNFVHDCNNCIFLESTVYNKEAYDLYYCPEENSFGGSIVARFGNEGHEYSSCETRSLLWIEHESILKKAVKIAYIKNLFSIKIERNKEAEKEEREIYES